MLKKFSKALSYGLVLLCCYIGSVVAEIVEVQTIAQVPSYIDQKTLVLFDIDNTVIELPQTLGTPQWFSDFYKNQINSGIAADKAMEITVRNYIRVNELSEAKAVETKTPNIIKNLQKKGITVLALTSRDDGLSSTTVRQLRLAGVNFNVGKFKDFQLKLQEGERSKVENGVIYSGGKHKGNCLKEFFGVARWNPKKVVFIDDQLKAVKEVEGNFAGSEVAYTGIRYGFLDEKVKSVNRKIHEAQLEHLDKNNILLSDKEAEDLLNSKRQVLP